MRRVSAKFVPRLLTGAEWKPYVCGLGLAWTCRNVWKILHERIITRYGTCIYGYDSKTNQQLSQWESPSSVRLKKAGQLRRKRKWLCYKGVVHHEHARGHTINQHTYSQVLRRLCDAVRRKSWIRRVANSPWHWVSPLRPTSWQFLAEYSIPQVKQPPYPSDMASCDCFVP
jgi:hypothetical protein